MPTKTKHERFLYAEEQAARHRTPDADQVRELCRLLHVSADVLLEHAPFELLAMPAKDTP